MTGKGDVMRPSHPPMTKAITTPDGANNLKSFLSSAASPPVASNNIAISVVSPVYGCEGCLEDLIERLKLILNDLASSFEILLINDCSPDQSWDRIVELARVHPEVRGIRLSRNFGQHYAIAAGIESALGDLVVVMDCDLQDAPESIPQLLCAAANGYDVVFAQRVNRKDSITTRITSLVFYKLLGYLTDTAQDHTTANFGVFSRKVIDTINMMPERERCFPLMVKWTGFRSIQIPVQHALRSTGKSGYSLRSRLRLALSIVLSYSDKPLRLVVKLGLMLSVVSLIIVAISIYRYAIGDIQVAGFTSIIASIWLLGGTTIFCLGIVGLYVGRLFNDVKSRPYYLISEHVNFPRQSDDAIVK